MSEEVLGVFPCLVRKQPTSLYITTDRLIFHASGSTAEDSYVVLLPRILGFIMNKPRPELPPEQQKALIKIQYRETGSSEILDRVIDFSGEDRFNNCIFCETILRENAGDKAEERRMRIKREQDRISAFRRQILEENPDKKSMFIYLTGEGGLSVDDFWEQYSDELMLKHPDAGAESTVRSSAIPVPLRRPDLLQSDLSSNVLTVSGRKETEMTREKADEIFKQFPKAKELYEQLVPSTISEKNFWKRFFHSQYFNLSQGNFVSPGTRADALFDSLVAENRPVTKPGSLAVDAEIDLTGDYSVGDSGVFSFREKGSDQANQAEAGSRLPENQRQAHSTLISRFNQVGTSSVLKTPSYGDDIETLRSRRQFLDRELDTDPIRVELSSLKESDAPVSKAEIEKLRRVRPLRLVRKRNFTSSEPMIVSAGMEGVAKATLELTAELVAPASLQAKTAETNRKARKLEASPDACEVNEYVERVVELLRFFYASKIEEIEKREKLLGTLLSVKNEMNNVLVPKLRLATEWTGTVNMVNSMVANAESINANLSRNFVK